MGAPGMVVEFPKAVPGLVGATVPAVPVIFPADVDRVPFHPEKDDEPLDWPGVAGVPVPNDVVFTLAEVPVVRSCEPVG